MTHQEFWTPEMDDAIRRAYESRKWGANKRVAWKLGVNPGRVSARAARLGLPPLVSSPSQFLVSNAWSEKELALVLSHLDEPIVRIRALLYSHGFRRSISAVAGVISRKRQSGQWPSRADIVDGRNSLKIADVARGLGVNLWTTTRWIKNGYLPVTIMGDDKMQIVDWRDLKRFLTTHQAHWDHRKADKWFLIEALTYERHNSPAVQERPREKSKPCP